MPSDGFTVSRGELKINSQMYCPGTTTLLGGIITMGKLTPGGYAVEIHGDLLIEGSVTTKNKDGSPLALISTSDLEKLETMSVEEAVTHENLTIRCLAKFLYRCANEPLNKKILRKKKK